MSYCVFGVWDECDAQKPTKEECNNLDDDCDGLIDNSPECYPTVPDIVWEEKEEEEEPLELDPIIVEVSLDDVERPSVDVKPLPTATDPASRAEIVEESAPYETISNEKPEILIEFAEPSGCQQSSKGTAVGILVLLFLATYFVGYLVGRVNDKD
jgi:hypothetical protein